MKRLLEHCLEQVISDRLCIQQYRYEDPVAGGISKPPDDAEECWCYEEEDGAPDATSGVCLACRLRAAIALLSEGE